MKGTKIFWHGQIFEQKNLQIVPFMGKEYAFLQFFLIGPPKSYARMGRAEALVARRLSGAVSAIATQVPYAKYPSLAAPRFHNSRLPAYARREWGNLSILLSSSSRALFGNAMRMCIPQKKIILYNFVLFIWLCEKLVVSLQPKAAKMS